MNPEALTVDYVGTLEARLIRKDGSHREFGVISSPQNYRLIGRPVQWWRALWNTMRRHKLIPITMGFAAFLAVYGTVDNPDAMMKLLSNPQVQAIFMAPGALVVTGGINYLMTDFASGGASPRISAMNFHDSGTGTIAATSTDSGLGTQAGPATRATGVQTNPATNQYRSVGTIAYVSTLAITEWGIFSANTAGTMWDRRVFSAINVVSGDSIAYTYTLTGTAGGT
jgi:hypothetical protein